MKIIIIIIIIITAYLQSKSVFDTGTISLPSSAKGFIISLPDETHELDTANRTVSHQNAHYLPSNVVIPSDTAIAFVHGNPNHIHVESVTDTRSRKSGLANYSSKTPRCI